VPQVTEKLGRAWSISISNNMDSEEANSIFLDEVNYSPRA